LWPQYNCGASAKFPLPEESEIPIRHGSVPAEKNKGRGPSTAPHTARRPSAVILKFGIGADFRLLGKRAVSSEPNPSAYGRLMQSDAVLPEPALTFARKTSQVNGPRIAGGYCTNGEITRFSIRA
jgi:hypothetical protein